MSTLQNRFSTNPTPIRFRIRRQRRINDEHIKLLGGEQPPALTGIAAGDDRKKASPAKDRSKARPSTTTL
jgi:hypothetical protein